MNIVIIAYRPDHTDYCRGCRMGSTESDMLYDVSDSVEEAAEFLAHRIFFNQTRDKYEYAEYEFTYIINGKDESDWEPESEEAMAFYRLQELASAKAYKLVEKHEEEKAKAEAAGRLAELEKLRQEELMLLDKLQKKHGVKS